jgi:hypothetical protein
MGRSVGELAKQFDDLIARKQKASADEKFVSAEMTLIEMELLEALSDAGLDSVKLASGRTLYKRVDKFYAIAMPEDVSDDEKDRIKAEFVSALANYPDTADLVKADYNANSLRSRIKEIEENGDCLPPEIQQLIRVIEKPKVGHRS